MPNRLQNQSYRPSPVVWGKHRSKWSVGLGSCFFRHDQNLGILGQFHKQKLISLRYKNKAIKLKTTNLGKVAVLGQVFPTRPPSSLPSSILLSNLLRFLYLPGLDKNNKIIGVFYQFTPYREGKERWERKSLRPTCTTV